MQTFNDHKLNPVKEIPPVILPEGYNGKILLASIAGPTISTRVILRSGDLWHREILRNTENEIRNHISEAECVLVGADSILFDGAIINGKPTCELAVTAGEFGIPFYSICETSKANTLSYLGKKVELKEGFDLAPGNLITGIVTEKGILDSKAVVEVMKNKSKFFETFHLH